MVSSDLADVFLSTRDTLEDSGVEDEFYSTVLAARLLVERVGESQNLGWWESRTLSETGRARLEEVTPKTRLKSQVNLALKVGRKAESDRLPEDAVSLFSFGPQMESRINAAIEEIENPDSITFESLENLSTQSVQEGWTDPVIGQIQPNTEISTTPFQSESVDGEARLIEDDGYTQEETQSNRWQLLQAFLHGYGQCTDELVVPYYRLESELKAENA